MATPVKSNNVKEITSLLNVDGALIGGASLKSDEFTKIIQTLLKYDIELYKIDVSGYEDVGYMPKEIFERRKQQASFIDNDNYLLNYYIPMLIQAVKRLM